MVGSDRTIHIDQGGDGCRPDEKPAQLVVLEGPARGRIVDIDKDKLTIGRLMTTDLVLPSAAVSKQHGVVRREGGNVAIEDLGSTNGIFINNQRVPSGGRRRLHHGDSIMITDHVLLFRQGGCFSTPGGMSTIHLDKEAIAKEADAFFDELKLDLPARE